VASLVNEKLAVERLGALRAVLGVYHRDGTELHDEARKKVTQRPTYLS
jgi:hypothetical protein